MADRAASEGDPDRPRTKKPKTHGFKWKDKKANDDVHSSRDQPYAGLQRGYRDRSPQRSSYRERSPPRDDYRDRSPRRNHPDRDSPTRDEGRARHRFSNEDSRTYNGRGEERDTHDRERDRYRERSPVQHNGGQGHRKEAETSKSEKYSSSTAEKFGLPTSKGDKKDKPKKQPKTSAPSEPMIIVNINDRLGTKAAIPCLASDSVKAFKAIVAAHIGRQPHEIMLKRQGERPFKDQLTLEDYGVSSGVQLDLEIDTGD